MWFSLASLLPCNYFSTLVCSQYSPVQYYLFFFFSSFFAYWGVFVNKRCMMPSCIFFHIQSKDTNSNVWAMLCYLTRRQDPQRLHPIGVVITSHVRATPHLLCRPSSYEQLETHSPSNKKRKLLVQGAEFHNPQKRVLKMRCKMQGTTTLALHCASGIRIGFSALFLFFRSYSLGMAFLFWEEVVSSFGPTP